MRNDIYKLWGLRSKSFQAGALSVPPVVVQLLPLVEEVLKRLDQIEVEVKSSKLQSCREEIVVWGLQICIQEISIVEKLLGIVQEAERLTNITELCSFVGLVNWQRMFLDNFVKLNITLQTIVKLIPTGEFDKHWTN